MCIANKYFGHYAQVNARALVGLGTVVPRSTLRQSFKNIFLSGLPRKQECCFRFISHTTTAAIAFFLNFALPHLNLSFQ